ncbi:MAG: patatin-like phospholipase family protein [Legionellaceae bacterium]|nr:patatin-like phospholipase family protein [Legionellaceae bacterium]
MPDQSKNKITRLVFSGGGARGVVYAGAYGAMVDTKVFQDVEDIAGSSAGAITAALLAVGLPSHEFQEKLKQTDFSQLLGNRSQGALIAKDAKPLYEFLQHNINTPIISFLEDQNRLDPDCQAILDRLNDGPGGSVTFAELHTLRQRYPETKRFKDLTVTAVKKDDGRLTFFNHETSPDVEIALACKASGAIPVVLEPVKIKGVEYFDGGIADNIPTNAFDNERTSNIRKSETLVFAFVEDNPTQKNKTWRQQIWTFLFCNQGVWNALYGNRAHEPYEPPSNDDELANTPPPPPLFKPYWWEVVWRNYLSKWLSSLRTDYSTTDKKDEGFQRIRKDYALRTVGLGVDDLLAVDFERAKRIARFMSVRGYLDTIDMIFNHDLQHVEQDKTIDDYPEEFYLSVINNFILIYTVTLRISGKDPALDVLLEQMSSLSTLSQYYLIRDASHESSNSDQAFALTRAVEYFKSELSYDALVEEFGARHDHHKPRWFNLFRHENDEPQYLSELNRLDLAQNLILRGVDAPRKDEAADTAPKYG